MRTKAYQVQTCRKTGGQEDRKTDKPTDIHCIPKTQGGEGEGDMEGEREQRSSQNAYSRQTRKPKPKVSFHGSYASLTVDLLEASVVVHHPLQCRVVDLERLVLGRFRLEDVREGFHPGLDRAADGKRSEVIINILLFVFLLRARLLPDSGLFQPLGGNDTRFLYLLALLASS